MNKKRLGDRLIEVGLIDENCLKLALRKQKREGIKLGEALVELGFIEEDAITNILASDIDAEFVNILDVDIDPEAVEAIPVELAKRLHIMPFAKDGDRINIASDDPMDTKPLDIIWRKVRLRARPFISSLRDIDTAIDKHYGSSETIEDIVDQIIMGNIDDKQLDAPVVRLVDKILNHAIRNTATDIHLEPEEKTLGVRMRVDGELREVTLLPKALLPTMVSRIKILSKLDVSEKRIPQDGSCTVKMGKHNVEIRVSTMPTIYGEKTVLRILDRGAVDMSLTGIELPAYLHEDTERKLHLTDPYGMILVTGPTGSGKTTSLYSMLNAVKSSAKAIYTIEDPVEYRIKGLQQIPAHDEIGFGFNKILRAILRQDPDIIMVGEIRDGETARLAIQAALTGHLVLSTLHTNNAVETIHRLADMGIEPFLIPAALHGVLAQRLVRRICPHCKEEISPSIVDEIVRDQNLDPHKEWHFWQGRGCKKCSNGFSGRVPIFEWLDIDQSYHEAISQKMGTNVIKEIADGNGFESMRDDGFNKASRGITAVSEILRVTKNA